VVPYVSKGHNAFILKGLVESEDCLTLKMKALWSFETSRTICPARQRHIPEGRNPQLHLRNSLQTRKSNISL